MSAGRGAYDWAFTQCNELEECQGDDGEPPYRVRWGDGGHETLFFPGPDAVIKHIPHADD
jgi:Domain of unknown function (DUF1918)